MGTRYNVVPLAKVDAINSQSCPGHLNDRRRRWVHVICGKVEIVNHQRVWPRSNGVRGRGKGGNLLFKILYFYSIKDFNVNHERNKIQLTNMSITGLPQGQ